MFFVGSVCRFRAKSLVGRDQLPLESLESDGSEGGALDERFQSFENMHVEFWECEDVKPCAELLKKHVKDLEASGLSRMGDDRERRARGS